MMCWQQRLLMAAVVLVATFAYVNPVTKGEGIDCFKCVSVNGSNPACEDPFHNNYTFDILERPCMAGRKNRNGLFPASSCIKVGGRFADGSGTIMVRGCALDSGTLTTDTEIIRMSHCGSFYFNDKYVHGCVQSCDDVDACNAATPAGGGRGGAVQRRRWRDVVAAASILWITTSSPALYHRS